MCLLNYIRLYNFSFFSEKFSWCNVYFDLEKKNFVVVCLKIDVLICLELEYYIGYGDFKV